MRTLLIVTLLACAGSAFAQTLSLRNGSDTLCTGSLLDPGAELNYAANQLVIATLCPSGRDRQLALTFRDVDIRQGDSLCIFDGEDVLARQLTCSPQWPREGIDVQASLDNPSGCLTLRWKTDALGQGRGFEAAVACRSICQSVVPVITGGPGQLDSAGVWQINLCAGELFDLTAGVAFPQNNRAYRQDPSSTSYLWRRADGSEHRGPVLTEAFATGGAYAFELVAIDLRGCRSLPAQRIRARVAPRPTFTLNAELPDTICAPEALQLLLDSLGGGAISTSTPTQFFPVITQRVDSLPLPDGTGAAHESSIPIAHFEPGTQLQNAAALQRVCATMEHSWLRDLSIELIAPDGRTIELHDHPGRFGTEAYLGVPIERDNNANPPTPGIGFEYCWTSTAERGTWLGYLRDNPLTQTLPAGDYRPRSPFTGLVGTPINGAWRLRVKDHWEADNGWIFSWRLAFADSLPLRKDSFSTQVVDLRWTRHPAQDQYSPTAISYRPSVPGTIAPVVIALDDFGCRYDTSFTIAVLPPNDRACTPCENQRDTLPNRDVVRGDTVIFDLAGLAAAGSVYRYSGSAKITAASNPTGRALEVPLNVRSAPTDRLGEGGAGLVAICVDVAARDAADLTLSLASPSGKTVLLASGELPGRVGFRQTCFRASLGVSLDSASAQNATVLKSRESWAKWEGERTTGTWILSLSDDRGLRDTTELFGFELHFGVDSAGLDLDVDAGVFQLADGRWATLADSSKTYRFASQLGTCSQELYIPLRVREPCTLTLLELGYSSPSCPQTTDGELSITAIGAQGRVRYQLGEEVNFDGKFEAVPSGPWRCEASDSVGCLAQLQGDLPSADTAGVDIFTELITCEPPIYAVAIDTFGELGIRSLRWTDDVRAYTDYREDMQPGSYRLRIEDGRGCITYRAVELPDFEPMQVQVLAKAPSCAEGGDGSVELIVQGGIPEYSAVWNDFDVGLQRRFLYAGRYSGNIEDRYGCQVDFSVEVPEGTGMQVKLEVDDVDCARDSSGSVRVTVEGGLAPLLYSLDGKPFVEEAQFFDLAAGVHTLTVQDVGFCESSASFAIASRSGERKALVREEIGLPASVLAGDTIQLRVPQTATAGESLTWEYTETAWFSCDTCAVTRFASWESGNLTLRRGIAESCPTVDRYQLMVESRVSVLVPTGFSPESATFSDRLLQVHGRSGTVIDRFAVFDRWGALIYEDRDFRVNAPRGWDGTLSGSPAPAGVYLYEVDVREVSGAVSHLRGSTQLVR